MQKGTSKTGHAVLAASFYLSHSTYKYFPQQPVIEHVRVCFPFHAIDPSVFSKRPNVSVNTIYILVLFEIFFTVSGRNKTQVVPVRVIKAYRRRVGGCLAPLSLGLNTKGE